MPAPHSRKTPQRLHPLWEGRPLLITTGLFLTFCVALLHIYKPQFIRQTELRLYDTMLSDRMTPPKTDIPVMVGIDDESLASYGQWPWPRYRLARLVKRLQERGAAVVALDLLMPEPDRTSPEVIVAERQRDRDHGAPYAGARPAPLDSNSQMLAETLAGKSTIIGYYFNFSGTGGDDARAVPVLPGGMVVASAPTSAAGWPRPTGMLRSLPLLTAAAGAEGFTNARHDIDGVLRRVPLLLKYHGEYAPSLSLGALLLASPDRNLRLANDGSDTAVIWGKRRIPVDHSGNLMIDFRNGRQPFPYLSAKDVLGDAAKAENLQGKIVVVGAWARGLGDVHQIPGGRQLKGLEVHATIIDNILSGTTISRPGWATGAELCAILLLGGLSTLLLSRSGFALSLFTVVAGMGGGYLGGKALLLSAGTYVSPLLPMATPVIIMAVLSLLKYGIEARKVLQRNHDLMEAQDAIIICMSALAETRDEETGGHILRTRSYVEVLARHLATLPRYRNLDSNSIDLLAKSAPLHDIGKVGIPDHILLKPGPLTQEEFAIIKTHTLIGARALTSAINSTAHPESLSFLYYAQQMTESHHERWDGSGYPHGLSGTDIPLAGRLMALADVYDALVCKRVYKPPFSHEEANEFILKESGRYFDPEVVAAYVAKNDEFVSIAQKFADEYFPDKNALLADTASQA